jgi:hypothetical protein
MSDDKVEAGPPAWLPNRHLMTDKELIADNFVNYKSRVTQSWLARHPKFELVFQPTYSPWVNQIEKLWKQLHDPVTRNHRQSTVNKLMHDVHTFMKAVSPFPGARHAPAPLQ